jgi:hypothetical protein
MQTSAWISHRNLTIVNSAKMLEKTSLNPTTSLLVGMELRRSLLNSRPDNHGAACGTFYAPWYFFWLFAGNKFFAAKFYFKHFLNNVQVHSFYRPFSPRVL